MGPQGAALCLQAGANDLGGTLMNESIIARRRDAARPGIPARGDGGADPLDRAHAAAADDAVRRGAGGAAAASVRGGGTGAGGADGAAPAGARVAGGAAPCTPYQLRHLESEARQYPEIRAARPGCGCRGRHPGRRTWRCPRGGRYPSPRRAVARCGVHAAAPAPRPDAGSSCPRRSAAAPPPAGSAPRRSSPSRHAPGRW